MVCAKLMIKFLNPFFTGEIQRSTKFAWSSAKRSIPGPSSATHAVLLQNGSQTVARDTRVQPANTAVSKTPVRSDILVLPYQSQHIYWHLVCPNCKLLVLRSTTTPQVPYTAVNLFRDHGATLRLGEGVGGLSSDSIFWWWAMTLFLTNSL